MRSPRFLPAAETELLHEVSYYSGVRPGAGVRFQAAVEAAVERVCNHPRGGAPGPRETRSVLVKGFPFSVVYRNSDEELLIVAIVAHRRKPNYWVSRLD